MNNKGQCVTDMRNRWVTHFKGNGESFAIPFNELYHMLDSISRAKAAGYKVRVVQIKN
jgi:hypothetical protein